MQALNIPLATLPAECEPLRAQVRAFLAEHMPRVPLAQRCRNWMAADSAFSRLLGQQGWLGMTWPLAFGGQARSALERYVVLEELLAAGAPVGAHWIAERQSGPLLMRYAPHTLAPRLVPAIARGELFFCIGMSEPDVGSDLAAVRSRAERDSAGGGWRIHGSKLWTSGAHRAHYMIALVRTQPAGAARHAGLSQFLIDMRSPGVGVRPVLNQLGDHDFNEVHLDGVLVPAENLIGDEGQGWQQVGAELALERSGPERYLSSTQLLLEMLDAASPDDHRQAEALGRAVAHYGSLRQMSLGVAGMLARGEQPALAAVLVKDQGALLEQSLPDTAHALFGGLAEPGSPLQQAMQHAALAAPSYSLRGGTREILRGIVAKGLGLR